MNTYLNTQGIEKNEYVLEIDTSRLVTFTQYAALREISQGRVSQLKSRNEIQTLFIPELSIELVVLQKSELELSRRLLPPVKEAPLHTFTYKQLGGYFADLIHEYEKTITSSDRLARESAQAVAQSEQVNATLQLQVSSGLEQLHLANHQHAQSQAQIKEMQDELAVLRPVKDKYTALEEELTKERILTKELEVQTRQLKKEIESSDRTGDAQSEIRKELNELKQQIFKLLEASNKKSKP